MPDRVHDVYVRLRPGESAKQRVFHDQVIFDLDASNNIIGVEMLGATQVSIDGIDHQEAG